jgi:Ca2+-transporting ATPase
VIFENIRNRFYLLSCNIVETAAVATPPRHVAAAPSIPFLNLVTDVFRRWRCSGGGPGTMQRLAPRSCRATRTQRHWLRSSRMRGDHRRRAGRVVGMLKFPVGYAQADAVSISFLTLGFAQVWHVFNARSPGSSFGNDVVRNPHVGRRASTLSTAWVLLATVRHVPAQGWARLWVSLPSRASHTHARQLSTRAVEMGSRPPEVGPSKRTTRDLHDHRPGARGRRAWPFSISVGNKCVRFVEQLDLP